MWTPRLRWMAEQSMQRKIPYVTDAHVGFFALQSKHIYKIQTIIIKNKSNRRSSNRISRSESDLKTKCIKQTLLSDFAFSFLKTTFLSVRLSEDAIDFFFFFFWIFRKKNCSFFLKILKKEKGLFWRGVESISNTSSGFRMGNGNIKKKKWN